MASALATLTNSLQNKTIIKNKIRTTVNTIMKPITDEKPTNKLENDVIEQQLNTTEESSISNLNSTISKSASQTIDTNFYLDILSKSPPTTTIYAIHLHNEINGGGGAGDEIIFEMSLTINDKKFIGCDTNRNIAAIKAAVSAIKYFKNIRFSAKTEFKNIVHLLYAQFSEIKISSVSSSDQTNQQIYQINIEV